MKNEENMKKEVYCFVMQFIIHPEGLRMFFLLATLVRKLRRCAETCTSLKRDGLTTTVTLKEKEH